MLIQTIQSPRRGYYYEIVRDDMDYIVERKIDGRVTGLPDHRWKFETALQAMDKVEQQCDFDREDTSWR